jgi:hypothetical protein
LSDLLEFDDKSPGCTRGLGFVTVLVNGGMTAAGILLLRKGSLGGVPLALLGGLGVLFGLVLLLGGYAAHIDRARRTLVQRWRIGVEVRRRETPLGGATAVVFKNHAHRTRHGWIRYHVVYLARPEGELFLRRKDDEAEALAFAREVAAFLSLPLRDERKDEAGLAAERSPLGARGRAKVVGVTLAVALVLSLVAAAVVLTRRQGGDDKPRRRGALLLPCPSRA